MTLNLKKKTLHILAKSKTAAILNYRSKVTLARTIQQRSSHQSIYNNASEYIHLKQILGPAFIKPEIIRNTFLIILDSTRDTLVGSGEFPLLVLLWGGKLAYPDYLVWL